ncbi:hypothetical protein KZZ52_01345 [Dactylosporangium sp. AC04546]|uniref:hypothetical protein n=1 Tax=Dactylosporangium sp. AC04546 TaxID=2862460 RepID=UPI001EDE3BD7|nr:hypothetical protein [Dactylosporangium sp. AC04546]WVK84115.1 hypothetical protein KZZ52_01345 [Dactylosporangium sp. AC04546]
MGKERLGSGPARFGRRPAVPPIARSALLERLDRVDRGVTLVVAGAGAGKSTLLSAWSAGRGGVLLNLELDPPQGPSGGTLVVDEADERHVEWINGLPNDRVVVAAQAPLPIRARQTVTARDLSFAEDETYQALGAALGDAAGADTLAPDLHLLTHGWPQAVGLAAAWLAQQKSAGEREAKLRSLARVDGPLERYLVGAVLDGLARDDRELVQKLAYLPGVDARRADRLDITENLVALPPFVQPVAGKPGWFAVPGGLRAAVQSEAPLSPEAAAALKIAYQGM